MKSKLNILWLLALVLFCPVAGLMINASVFAPRSLVVLLAWTALLLAPYVATRKKWLYVVAATIVFVDGFINLFHWCILRCPLNASSIFVFLNTNFSEASEFMSIKLTPRLLLLIPYTVLYIIALRNIPPLSLHNRRSQIVWSAIWLAVALFFADNLIHKRFVRLAVPDVERALISFANEARSFRNLRTRALATVDASLTTDDTTVVVVIIGESCNRNHLSLYGYGRKTTPRLHSRSDLMVFDNVVSANSNTLRSFMNFMTTNNAELQRPLDSCLHIFDIVHSTPYKSYWISNQSPIGLWDNGVTSLAQNADITTFVNIAANSSMESTLISSYDENLLPPLATALADTARNKLIFLHLMGNHTKYEKRYPPSYACFDVSGDKKTRTINAYDNSVYYNDFIVDTIFSILKTYSSLHEGTRISALYFSDHGENVYDDGDYAGHDYSGRIPNANVEIPFLLWMSPTQKTYLASRNIDWNNRTHSPYMIDDLFYTLLDLCDVSVRCFDPKRSILNPDFDSTRRRLLEDGNEYTTTK